MNGTNYRTKADVWCESEKVKAALTCMHVISDVTPWLWGSQLSSPYHCVPGCDCQRDIPCQTQGPLSCASWLLVTQFFDDGFPLLVWVMNLSEVTSVGSFLSVSSLYSSGHDWCTHFFQVQHTLPYLQPTLPVIMVRILDALWED